MTGVQVCAGLYRCFGVFLKSPEYSLSFLPGEENNQYTPFNKAYVLQIQLTEILLNLSSV